MTFEYERIYPIGIQTFSEIIERKAVYVDKTSFIYQLVQRGKVYFFARPRRFGKSLLLSTLEAYFKGQKEFFKGLAIEQLEKSWTPHPVFRLDMSWAKNCASLEELRYKLNTIIRDFEAIYGVIPKSDFPDDRLRSLIQHACEQTGQKAVLLIDEYDAPLLSVMHDTMRFGQFRNELRKFYMPVKTMCAELKFVFITGITKFSQLSIFSELNNLNNISMDDDFSALCGISKEELLSVFDQDIEYLANIKNCSKEEMTAQLKKNYDGYHFSENSSDMFNPFSLLNCLYKKNIGHYWFASATPTFLTEQLKKYPDFDIESLDRGFWATKEDFDVPLEFAENPIPVLYQSGYLTIKKYNAKKGTYFLAYPNEEVRSGFTQCLVPGYVHKTLTESKSFLLKFSDALDEGDVDTALNLAKAFLSSIPYQATKLDENFYRTVIYLLCRVLTPFVTKAEEMSAAGRADMVVETDDAVYCFEFKLNDSPQAALKQIDDKGYLVPYSANGKQLVKIGVQFDGEKRTLGDWIVVKE